MNFWRFLEEDLALEASEFLFLEKALALFLYVRRLEAFFAFSEFN